MQRLNSILQNLNLFDGQKDYRGVLFSHDWKNTFSYEITEKLNDVIQPDAVYQFDNQPFILFFDFTQLKNDSKIIDFHHQVWCFDKAPIVIAIYEKDIKIYNAFKYENNNKLKQIVIKEDEIYRKFSFWELQSGKTWEWLIKNYKNDFNFKYRVNQKLFDNIKSLRTYLTTSKIQSVTEKDANIFILRLIFSRYLIDRGVDISNFIYGDSLEKKKQSFNDLIADKIRIESFFEHLKNQFNGNLFENQLDIHEENLKIISNIFKGNFETNQLLLFDIYDFNIIPVETISGIYEAIINPETQKQNSAVYTPSFLVDHILTETIDIHLKDKSTFKLLDPACGSGIFLVQAFRRLAQKAKDREPETLCNLVKENLFGIDRDVNALNVAIFSIYVAILDFKKPIDILTVKLPNLLDENLFRNDFFNVEDALFDEEPTFHKYNERFKSISFDFIVGNPPWGKKNNPKHDQFHLKYIANNYPNIISKFEISQSFILRSKDFCKDNTICVFIVISSAFHSIWAKKFSKYFFENFFVDKFFDLSPVRHLIFNAAAPAAVVFYRYARKEGISHNITTHISLKYNYYVEHFRKLVIDSQEIKTVSQKELANQPWLLKTLLYGTKLDKILIKKLKKINFSIDNYLVKRNNEAIEKVFFYGDGLKKWNKEIGDSFNEIKEIPIVELSQIEPIITQVEPNNLPKLIDLYVKSGRKIELYKGGSRILLPPHPEKETEIVASYINGDAVYREKVLGISSTDIDSLKILLAIFNSDLFTYYQFLTSGAWGTFFPEIKQEEYKSFPYIEPIQKTVLIHLVDRLLEISKNEQDILLGGNNNKLEKDTIMLSINNIINETYELDELECDLVNYVLNISRYEFKKDKYDLISRSVTNSELLDYAHILYTHFSNLYNREGECFTIEIRSFSYFTALKCRITNFVIKEKINFVMEDSVIYERLFGSLLVTPLSSDIFIKKDIKGFEKDGFYIIKPNQYKHWHPAIAHNDISEFMTALDLM